MRKNYEIHDINEMGNPNMFMDKKAHHRFGYQRRIKDANCLMMILSDVLYTPIVSFELKISFSAFVSLKCPLLWSRQNL